MDFLLTEFIEKGIYPSISEIAQRFGFSKVAAYNHILALERKGYIGRDNGKPRLYQILKNPTIFYGTVGDLFIQVAPKGTAKFKEKL